MTELNFVAIMHQVVVSTLMRQRYSSMVFIMVFMRLRTVRMHPCMSTAGTMSTESPNSVNRPHPALLPSARCAYLVLVGRQALDVWDVLVVEEVLGRNCLPRDMADVRLRGRDLLEDPGFGFDLGFGLYIVLRRSPRVCEPHKDETVCHGIETEILSEGCPAATRVSSQPAKSRRPVYTLAAS